MQFSLPRNLKGDRKWNGHSAIFRGNLYAFVRFFSEDLNLLPKVIRKHGIYHWRVGLMTIFELELNYISFEDICLKNVKI